MSVVGNTNDNLAHFREERCFIALLTADIV